MFTFFLGRVEQPPRERLELTSSLVPAALAVVAAVALAMVRDGVTV
jgi:hypothetical protein